MMRLIIGSSLRFRYLVLALGVVLTWFGLARLRDDTGGRVPGIRAAAGRDPDHLPRAVARRGRALVTVPLENALNGVPGIDMMRSKSVPQLSSIVLIFKPGADVIRARQLVRSGWRSRPRRCRPGPRRRS